MRRRRRQRLFDQVVDYYVGSGDFNGLYVTRTTHSKRDRRVMVELVRDGLLQVVSDADFLNPHIRPWASQRAVADQLADIGRLDEGTSFCLYPTPLGMKGRPELRGWPDQPYKRRLAAGGGTLELAYFKVDVVEQYRNDPRYHYWSSDFEVHFGIGDEAFLDEEEDERDKIASLRVGFAYDKTTIRADRVERLACAFLGDLADLTPEHQQRWQTYEVVPNETTGPHPMWWAMQMGHWPDGRGPFERILGELAAVSDLFELVYGKRLFRNSARAREWGWVLRPSTQEWHQFLLATDKLLSDNMDHAALTAAGIQRQTPEGVDAGSLLRLQWWLETATPAPANVVADIIEPLRRVRKERQKPAHALVVAETDATLTAQQRDLLHDVAEALYVLRQVLEMHPNARDVWTAPSHLDEGVDYLV